MIRQTGGTAVGETITRSRPSSLAMLRACLVCRIPSCWPSEPMTRTSRNLRQRSLINGPGSGRGSRLNPLISVYSLMHDSYLRAAYALYLGSFDFPREELGP